MSAIRGDIYGGLTAAVVALPLALAFGVASGAGPITGVYGAILIGFFAAAFGGTATQISGPTGPMTVVMASIITLFMASHPENGLAMAFTIVVLGGVFQIVLGLFKLGRFINLVPYTVVSGFMTGIGVIIILLQFIPFIGSSATGGSPVSVIMQMPALIDDIDLAVLLFSALLLAALFAWPAALTRYLPAPLFALIAGTVVSVVFFAPEDFIRLGEVPSGFPSLHLPTFSTDAIVEMLKYGAVLGFLGSIDSLLTSLVADSMTRTEHDSNKELVGQGIGNIFSGLFGGLPGAGATMRTVVNIKAGGTTRLSGIIHSLTLIVLISIGGNVVSEIPQAVLAAILVKVGFDIIDWDFLKRLRRAPLSSIVILLTVLLLTVFVDLITAVAVGIIIASLYAINRLTEDQVSRAVVFGQDSSTHLSDAEKQILETMDEHVLVYALSGPFSFGAAKSLSSKLRAFTSYDVLILDLTDVTRIDTSTALAIEDMVRDARTADRVVFLACDNDKVITLLGRLKVTDLLGQHKIRSSRLEAIEEARLALEKNKSASPPEQPDSA